MRSNLSENSGVTLSCHSKSDRTNSSHVNRTLSESQVLQVEIELKNLQVEFKSKSNELGLSTCRRMASLTFATF